MTGGIPVSGLWSLLDRRVVRTESMLRDQTTEIACQASPAAWKPAIGGLLEDWCGLSFRIFGLKCRFAGALIPSILEPIQT